MKAIRGIVLSLCVVACGKNAVGTSGQAKVSARLTNGTSVIRDVSDSASSSATSVQSLKYVFGQMQICQDLAVNGSMFNGGTGCVTIYDWGKGDPSTVTAANLASYADVSVDLMSPTGMSEFNARSGATVPDGTYKYVTVNWAPYIAVNASVDVGGTEVHTAQCAINASSGLCEASTSLTSGSAAESVVKSANGGTWFKFQHPFVVAASGATGDTEFAIDLAFNPEGAVAASKAFNIGGGFGYGVVSDATGTSAATGVTGALPGHALYVPMIQLSPMPRRVDHTTSRETYRVTLPSNAGTARIELFYDSADGTKTIYGVNVLTLLSKTNAGSLTQIDNGSKVATIDTDGSGTLTLKGTDGVAIVSGLSRGGAGTVTVTQLGGASGSASYTFDGTTSL